MKTLSNIFTIRTSTFHIVSTRPSFEPFDVYWWCPTWNSTLGLEYTKTWLSRLYHSFILNIIRLEEQLWNAFRWLHVAHFKMYESIFTVNRCALTWWWVYYQYRHTLRTRSRMFQTVAINIISFISSLNKILTRTSVFSSLRTRPEMRFFFARDNI